MNGGDGDTDTHEFDTLDLLQLAREEGQRTVDKQIDTFDDIDDKAARILRLNLLVLSVLLTGFSIIATENGMADSGAATELENPYVFTGVLAILVSTVLAAFTYTGSNYRSGMSGRDLEQQILNAEIRPIDALYDTVEGYAEWAQHNFSVNTRRSGLHCHVTDADLRAGPAHGRGVPRIHCGSRSDSVAVTRLCAPVHYVAVPISQAARALLEVSRYRAGERLRYELPK